MRDNADHIAWAAEPSRFFSSTAAPVMNMPLQTWSAISDRKKNIMSKEHKRRLNKIGFVWRLELDE